MSDPLGKVTKKYQKHPISIINNMLSSVENEASFSFTCVSVDDILKEKKRLGINKATQKSDISTKLRTHFQNLFIDFLHKNVTLCCTESTSPSYSKKAVVHPTHKNKNSKLKYCILPNLSKIYERLI